MKKIKKWIERMVEKTDSMIVDRVCYISLLVLGILAVYLFIKSMKIIYSPILDTHSKALYAIIIVFSVVVFYISMLGEKTNKPVNRPKMFLAITTIICVTTYSLLAETLNSSFTTFLNSLLSITDIPSYLILPNIRIITVFVPIFIVLVTFNKTLSISFVRESKDALLEYSLDILSKNVNEISHRTVNLKICEDIKSGESIVLSEKSSFQHIFVGGSSGSGKTALVIRPQLAQLFKKKAMFREKIKELTFMCLEEDICYLKAPVTNKYINDNFNMDLIGIYPEHKEKFLEIFKDYIIGVREGKANIYSSTVETGTIKIPVRISNDIKGRRIYIKSYYKGVINEEYNFIVKSEESGSEVREDEYSIEVFTVNSDNEEYKVEFDLGGKEYEILVIDIKPLSQDSNKYTFKVDIEEETEGKIVYRDLGVTVVAPDGGLPSNAIEIAKENGVKVHKIDPKMEEIVKGDIAKFNPLLVGTPEKAGDVLASIMITMQQSSGKDANPYYIETGIRAIRNIVILLRVMHPKVYNENPNLEDVLRILNNFNLVEPYVEAMKKDSRLEKRWKSVIDYFITCFYPVPTDEQGNAKKGTEIGINRKKTSEALTGTINQFDNFLGREELRYILCDREQSLNLSDLLENGECLAIATRQSELGDILGKAFALMFILSMQNAVLGRYSEDEQPEIPQYLVIDEFPFYLNDQIKVFFTFSRKYKTSITCVIQNIAQLCEESDVFKQIIISNTDTKIILPGANVEDRQYYSELLGIEEIFEMQTGISQNPILSEKAKYTESTRGGLVEKAKVSTQELAELQFKRCFYAYTNQKGKKCIGKGFVDFLKLTDDNTIKETHYDFAMFNDIKSASESELKNIAKDNIIVCKSKVSYSESNEVNEYDSIESINVNELECEAFNELQENNINENSNDRESRKPSIEKCEKLLNSGSDVIGEEDRNGPVSICEETNSNIDIYKSLLADCEKKVIYEVSNTNNDIEEKGLKTQITHEENDVKTEKEFDTCEANSYNVEVESSVFANMNIDDIDTDNIKLEGLAQK